jgi:NADH-quinone oxidoreductase subunit J
MVEHLPQIFFFFIAAIAVASAVSVVVQRGPLQSALSLIVTFGAFAALYVMLKAQFIAVIQVIVYAGAIIVLFVFVIMLLNVRSEESRIERNRPLKLVTVLVVGGAMLAVLASVVQPAVTGGRYDPVRSIQIGSVESIGRALFTDYLLPFEVTSVLILMAIVGAMVLARRGTEEHPEEEVETPEEIILEPAPDEATEGTPDEEHVEA